MRCLAFQLGERRYALPLSDIVEVLPLLTMRSVPRAPAYISGLVNYRGRTVPVLDLCQLTLDRPCEVRMSTRMLMIRHSSVAAVPRLFGLLVERAVDTLDLASDSLQPPPVRVDETPYLKGLSASSAGMVQRVEVAHLLPDEVLGLLYPDEVA